MAEDVYAFDSQASFDRNSKVMRWVEGRLMNGTSENGLPAPIQINEDVIVRVTGAITGDGYYPGTITFFEVEIEDWLDGEEVYVFGLNEEDLEEDSRYMGKVVGQIGLPIVMITVGGGSGVGTWLRITGPISVGAYPATERIWDGSAFADGDEVQVYPKSDTVLLEFSDNADEYIGLLRSGTSDPKVYDAYGHRTDTFEYPLTYTGTIDPETCTVTLSVDTTQTVTLKAIGLEVS